jgi:hypothetical protein
MMGEGLYCQYPPLYCHACPRAASTADANARFSVMRAHARVRLEKKSRSKADGSSK